MVSSAEDFLLTTLLPELLAALARVSDLEGVHQLQQVAVVLVQVAVLGIHDLPHDVEHGLGEGAVLAVPRLLAGLTGNI